MKVYSLVLNTRHQDDPVVKLFLNEKDADDYWEALPEKAESKWFFDKENSYPPTETEVE